ncbi:MAG: DUF87 domain-containing protein [Candidatus Krumholzibacteria bacterium]|nr:DUF87 domain-containing protein [Candidatus Krumholzibacteria bacterium]MDH4336133.1 DUF87 domain-containing protein [Candidatus Krumholzibacteria bacterium]MDH5268774.1 DUF87 domain-containing protein [Candidatus Krumholzibacteria bacterium]
MDTSYEKLGAFYLGREVDAGGSVTDTTLLYDSRDLTTHAVCVGMTGSGKTGLCIALLEEAAIDGVPAIVIDPKGDLADLMLTFPDLAPESFRPWINEDTARQQGITPDELAGREAAKWVKGLAEWGQGADRIRRLRESAEFTLYTPGSDAARAVSVLASLEPPRAAGEGAEVIAERASGVVSSLLSLLGVEADPLRSREHILLTMILQHTWEQNRKLDLAALVQTVQQPPFTRVGVMELESFFPSRDRFGLAMLLNNLLASPGFQPWLTGDALDIDRMLYTESGKPRVAIFSIAHLDDAQRMFFVSLLLNEVVAWMRTRSGTSSLRALVYMDEIFGFMPPVEEPPSKRPLLTLMKQARAFGVGVVLATQNPVDLDYKALSNAGTWFIGRLQTERDKKRLADGLASATGSVDAKRLETVIGSLEPRTFLMHNIHDDAPVVFRTRWVMSYLAGPLTRAQLRRLPGGGGDALADAPQKAPPGRSAPVAAPMSVASLARPVLPAELPQIFGAAPAGASVTYVPYAIAEARVHVALPDGSPHTRTVVLEAPLAANLAGPDWSTAQELDRAPEPGPEPAAGASFGDLPAAAGRKGSAAAWSKAAADALYRGDGITLHEVKRLRLLSKPGESERDFRVRIADALRVDRDERVDKLRAKYSAKLATLEDRIRRAETTVAREKDQANSQRMQTAVSVGATLLTAFMGRKRVSQAALGRATTAARGVDRTARQQRDVAHAQDNARALRAQYESLAAELQEEIREIETAGAEAAELTTRTIRPKKSDIDVLRVAVLWRASQIAAAGA